MQKNQIKLPLTNLEVTMLISINQGWSSNEALSQICGMSNGYITEKIDRLENLKLVAREGGGRATTYILTNEGQKIVNDVVYLANIAFLEMQRNMSN